MLNEDSGANEITQETGKGSVINYQAFLNVIHGPSCIGSNWRLDQEIHIFNKQSVPGDSHAFYNLRTTNFGNQQRNTLDPAAEVCITDQVSEH